MRTHTSTTTRGTKIQKYVSMQYFFTTVVTIDFIMHSVVFSLRLMRKYSVFVLVLRNVIFGAELVQTTDLRGRAGKV